MNEKRVPIICPYCGVGCNIELLVKNDNVIKVVVSGRNPDLNGKFVCIKGLSVPEILKHEERLKFPLIKMEEKFINVSWAEAIQKASVQLKEIIETYGPNSVGVLVSGKITNEEAYLAQKFARTVIRTHNVDTCARLCHSPSEVALRMQFGYGAVSACLNDFASTDITMLVGANSQVTHPGVWNILKKREVKNKLITADVFEVIPSADLKIITKPGTDLIWLNGLSKIIVDRELHDLDFINQRTIGFESFKKSLKLYTKDFVERTSNVSYEKLNEIVELITGKKTMFVWGMGLTQHANGTDAVISLCNLAMLTGNLGKKGTGVVPLRGQNNVQGAVDMGSAPFSLPGSYDVSDKGALSHFEGFWNIKLPVEPGLSATEMIHKISEGKMKALYVIGENPALSEPQSGFVKWMLRGLDLLIVQDIFLTETAKLANIILPAAALGEKKGTTTNAARRIQYSEKAVEPPGSAKTDWQIIQLLANKMGHNWTYQNSEEIWNEVRDIAPIFKGASYQRLIDSNGLFWPIYDDKHQGTKRLYVDRFMFRDGRARFFPIKPPSFFISTTEEYPFMLVTHRHYEHFNTGEMTRRSKLLTKKEKTGFVEIGELDANKFKLENDSQVRINSPYGSIVSRIKIVTSKEIPSNHLYAPIHFFNTSNFNELTSTFPLDSRARMPSLKRIPVNLNKLEIDR